MVTVKEELVAASIRKQIAYLEGLLKELEEHPVKDKQILLKTREVETKLKQLRSQLLPDPI